MANELDLLESLFTKVITLTICFTVSYFFWVSVYHVDKEKVIPPDSSEHEDFTFPMGRDGDGTLTREEESHKNISDRRASDAGRVPATTATSPKVLLAFQDQEILKLKGELLAVKSQKAEEFSSTVALFLAAAKKDQELASGRDDFDGSEYFKATIEAYENEIRSLGRSFNGKLCTMKQAHSDCQRLLEAQATRHSTQDATIRALETSLSDAENKLQQVQALDSTQQQCIQEQDQRSVTLSSQLQAAQAQLVGSREQLKEYHDRLWPLADEHSRLKAELTYLRQFGDIQTEKTSNLIKLKQEHSQEKARLRDRIETLERLHNEAATSSESWRMKFEISRDFRATGDITMADAPSLVVEGNRPRIFQLSLDNQQLRRQIEYLTQTLEESKLGAINTGRESTQYQLKIEATTRELMDAKNELDNVVKDYLGLLEILESDPMNLHDPIYQKMECLQRYIKESEEENAHLKEKLLEARALSWDRRTSMVVEYLSPN